MERCNRNNYCCNNNNNCCIPKENFCNSLNNTCRNTSCHDCYGKITNHIKCAANKAWGDLMKEKIKKIYEKKMGSKIDKLAQIAAESAIKCLQHKICTQECCKEYECKIHNCISKFK